MSNASEFIHVHIPAWSRTVCCYRDANFELIITMIMTGYTDLLFNLDDSVRHEHLEGLMRLYLKC